MSSHRDRASWSRDEVDCLDWLPTPSEYEHAHELAVLAVLVANLDVVAMVLLAENREIGDDDRPAWRPFHPTVPAAERVLRDIDRIRRSLMAYRRAAAPPATTPSADPAPATDEDIPF
jgi:hypothetical protein